MEKTTPVCDRQDTLLPTQNQQPDCSSNGKNLQVTLLRITRAIALQMWRMQCCKKYSEDHAFMEHLYRLMEALGFVLLAIDQDWSTQATSEAASVQQVKNVA